jgi:hypothetical protein
MLAGHPIEKLAQRGGRVRNGTGVDADDPLGTEAGNQAGSTGVGQVPSSIGAGSASADTAGRLPSGYHRRVGPGQAVIDVLALAGEKISAVTASLATDMADAPRRPAPGRWGRRW